MNIFGLPNVMRIFPSFRNIIENQSDNQQDKRTTQTGDNAYQ